jgi:hypothetical protein
MASNQMVGPFLPAILSERSFVMELPVQKSNGRTILRCLFVQMVFCHSITGTEIEPWLEY